MGRVTPKEGDSTSMRIKCYPISRELAKSIDPYPRMDTGFGDRLARPTSRRSTAEVRLYLHHFLPRTNVLYENCLPPMLS